MALHLEARLKVKSINEMYKMEIRNDLHVLGRWDTKSCAALILFSVSFSMVVFFLAIFTLPTSV